MNECRLYTKEKSGHDIEFKVQQFDSHVDWPDSYEVCNNDDFTALIDTYEYGLCIDVERLKKDIDDIFSTEGSHASVSKMSKMILKK